MDTMRSDTRLRLRTERGASLLELVLLLPVLVVLVFGVIDLGRLIHARLVITNVSREGGSLAARNRDPANLMTLLQTSAVPFDLANSGRIYVTKIGAENPLGNPPQNDPYIISRSQAGSLSASSTILGAVQGRLQSGLSQTMMNHLTIDSQTNTTDIIGVTVVEVFYHYRPITPLPMFVQGLFPNNGGIIIGSRSVFQTGGDR
jgi:hypothetical protein